MSVICDCGNLVGLQTMRLFFFFWGGGGMVVMEWSVCTFTFGFAQSNPIF